MAVYRVRDAELSASFPIVIVGAGAAGCIAALTAREAGCDVLVVERDRVPRGSTALSAGLIPAAGTRWQKAAGIDDNPGLFERDILRKAHDEPDGDEVALVAATIGPTLEWLADRYGLDFDVVENFNYPGHSVCRMHGLASRSGAELIDALRAAVESESIDLLVETRATDLILNQADQIAGLRIERNGRALEDIGCSGLVLACNGFGANPDMVARHVPAMQNALYFGHPGNCGEAVLWGEAIGARLRDLSGYQGHGSVAYPQGILISWATIMQGGFQVNREGLRFSDETLGYSEQAAVVLGQPDGLAWTIFDDRIASIARQFEDFRLAEAAGAVFTADSPERLAELAKLPVAAFAATFAEVSELARKGGRDPFGREYGGQPPLAAPLHAVCVTGALFHTQGGLAIDRAARVLRNDGTAYPNLFACGGAACGVSGSEASGYLSGNGLLTAVALGRVAGRSAAILGAAA